MKMKSICMWIGMMIFFQFQCTNQKLDDLNQLEANSNSRDVQVASDAAMHLSDMGTIMGADTSAPRTNLGSLPPTHAACRSPKTLLLSNGFASVDGDTTRSSDEFPNVNCGRKDTSWRGPQLYYKVTLTGGKKHIVAATGKYTILYAFPAKTACNVSLINVACKNPDTGTSDVILNSSGELDDLRVLQLAPKETEEWILVVDSAEASKGGPFHLAVTEKMLTNNDRCNTPEPLSFVHGVAEVLGTREGATDEFPSITCGVTYAGGTSYPLNGSQRYYRATLSAGKTYKTKLIRSRGEFSTLYAMPAKTPCTLGDVNSACQNPDPGTSQTTHHDTFDTLQIVPTQTEDWIFFVDHYKGPPAQSAFLFRIFEGVQPSNTQCINAKPLTFSNGSVSDQGDSTFALNQFGNALTCDANLKSSVFSGPQVFYRFSAQPGQVYSFSIQSDFDNSGYLLFPESDRCKLDAINVSCGSAGIQGMQYTSYLSGKNNVFDFSPKTPGNYIFAIGGLYSKYFGSYHFTIKERAYPSNSKCLSPKELLLSQSPLRIRDDTTTAINEFGNTIKCGNKDSFQAAQLYYKVRLMEGMEYTIGLSTKAYSPSIYAFLAGTCDESVINTQCKLWNGKNTMSIHPEKTADYILVVDGVYGTLDPRPDVYPFTLEIAW